MRLIQLCLIFCLLFLSKVYAQEGTFSFVIDEGEVNVSPAFCIPEQCAAQVAKLSGQFDATLNQDGLFFLKPDTKSIPDVGFVLPAMPSSDSSGTVRQVEYDFDGSVLKVSGSVDMRAFDGPLYEYRLQARVKSDDTEGEEFDTQGYYLVKQDLRRCASPMCGGVFVQAVNKRRMRCLDGSRATECYVAAVDWEHLGFNPLTETLPLDGQSILLLKGKVQPKTYEGFGNLGIFVLKAAFRPATSNLPEGTFYGVKNNGIVCITSPCFSGTEFKLNSSREKSLSGVDLNPVGAGIKEMEEAYRIFSESVLIAVGNNSRRREMNGRGLQFSANQFYLPIQSAQRQCGKGYEWRDERCLTPNDCEAPLLEQTAIGGAVMIDPITGEQHANITYSCVKTCASPASETGPGRCLLALP